MNFRFFKNLFLLSFLNFFLLNSLVCASWTSGSIITPSDRVIDENLNIDGTITVSGAVRIGAYTGNVAVNITTDDVKIKPWNNVWYGMLIFDAKNGHQITVNCDYDFTFSGENLPDLGPSGSTDMIVTFTGLGTTKFILSQKHKSEDRGVKLSFTGTSTGYRGYNIERSGTHVYVCMDQSYANAVTNGNNKVIFQGRSHGADYKGYQTGIVVGPASFITFISTNATGDGCGTHCYSDFGSLAFDPSFTATDPGDGGVGSGRLYLEIQSGDHGSSQYNFHDGGVVVYGHYVPSFGETDIWKNVYLNTVAGNRALFRIIDDVAFNANGAGYDPGDTLKRGLLVINKNTTVPKLASDPYQDYGDWISSQVVGLVNYTPNDISHPSRHGGATSSWYWAYDYAWRKAAYNYYLGSNYRLTPSSTNPVPFNVQTGFILGVNGEMQVYHKTFLDYVAYNTKNLDWFAVEDFSDYQTGTYSTWGTPSSPSTNAYFKYRNPAAFIVDGLNEYSNYNDLVDNDYTASANAQIVLYGDAKVIFRAGLDKNGNLRGQGYGPWKNSSGDYRYTFSIDYASYNAQYIYSSYSTTNEGENVLDIEGNLRVDSLARTDTPTHSRGAYTAATTEEKGEMNLATVSIDYMGRLCANPFAASLTELERPLEKDTYYFIYNSPSIFMNAHMSLYNTIFNHNDMTKLLSTDPNAAVPNIVGGEAKYFNEQIWASTTSDVWFEKYYEYPRFYLYDSSLDLHEHMVSSGIRWVITEKRYDRYWNQIYSFDAKNTSTIMFYDHGDYLDTLDHAFGRLFMVGSGKNLMSDGSTNSVVESGFVNIYRNNKVISPNFPAQTINLSIQSTDDISRDFRTTLLGSTDKQRAHHLFLLSRGDNGKSYMDLGWTTTYGHKGDNLFKEYNPWSSSLGTDGTSHFDLAITTSFPLGSAYQSVKTKYPPATLSIDGNYIYFGGTDWSGNGALAPVSTHGLGSVIYVNHGGRLTITQPADVSDIPQHGYDTFIDIPVAYRLWSWVGLCGIVDLPKDQVMYGYGYGCQPYDINNNISDAAGNPTCVHINTYNSSLVSDPVRVTRDRHSGEEVTIPWRWRTYDVLGNTGFESGIVKNIPLKNFVTRFTGIVNEEVTMPDNILYFGAGENPDGSIWADQITQLKVAGATLADPLHLLVTGSAGSGYARIYEIVSLDSSPVVPGEGQHAMIFLSNGGRIGLGSRHFNEHSKNAWNLLGKDYVTIGVEGDGVIDLNSDIFVTDGIAFVPTNNFAEHKSQRLTINLNGNDLYIPSGSTLDLSAFGSSANRQEIAFAGTGRVVIEPGATIRFPASATTTPVLYFNDETEFVCDGSFERNKNRITTLSDADDDKIKIFGYGQIWLNKNARWKIMGDAKVRIGSDIDTPETDFTISIQKQGKLLIGDNNVSGGSLEIGNPSSVTGRDGITDGRVDFTLAINGVNSSVHIDRSGFLGLGVGVIDKSYDNMNGNAVASANPIINGGVLTWMPDTTNAWQVSTLSDVRNITVTITKGVFDSSNIFNGTDRLASMIAVGPISGVYTFELTDKDKSRILGGANIMHVSDGFSPYINAWDYADDADRTSGDRYSILASSPVILQQKAASFTNSTVSVLDGGGIKIVTGATRSIDLFTFLKYPNYSGLDRKFVIVGATQLETYLGYVNNYNMSVAYPSGAEIFRRTNINITGPGVPDDGLEIGVLGARGTNMPGQLNVVGK